MSEPMGIRCDKCKAPPGQRCLSHTTRDGVRRLKLQRPHAARVRAAEREERGKEKEREAHIAEISTRETLNDD